MSDAIETGDKVTINFEGRLEDGSTFHTFEQDPFTGVIGKDELVSGLEKELMGMKEGEEKKFKIPPEEGYGHENPELVQIIEANVFEGVELKPEKGQILQTPHGNCYVMEVTEENVKINYNHPLAGKELYYYIKVESVQKKVE
jgi:FKBP-type peptidyl-prolyl cis-trans isomerase 2